MAWLNFIPSSYIHGRILWYWVVTRSTQYSNYPIGSLLAMAQKIMVYTCTHGMTSFSYSLATRRVEGWKGEGLLFCSDEGFPLYPDGSRMLGNYSIDGTLYVN